LPRGSPPRWTPRRTWIPLNIVCFRYHPVGLDDPAELDEINRRTGAALLEDGRVYVGTTTFEGKVAFRPAIVNWRSTESDIDLVAEVVRELGARIAEEIASQTAADR
jgi:glutamate/tyrosine decarboxylase-like PLP-dependent enzyme